ncbi:alpha/beta hydrolase family protein [Marisediminicola senii]|uniref:alpha/beta hydrolase family protein n=1 Tax=Marisediminicola senii TaxID=2711233 RepID=UPI0013EA8766|nr:alpha/beta family hydrolase [Marisediminicola senii]
MQIAVPTSLGPARLTVAAASTPRAVLWLGHGAGGGIDAVDLAAIAAVLPAHGVTVVREEQPWRVAGKRVAPRPATLDTGWRESAAAVVRIAGSLPVVVGGRSAGARVACRTATELGAAAVVCLAFPLHPPGSPAKTRIDELLLPAVPVLVLQGDRDTFGSAAAVSSAIDAHTRDVRDGDAHTGSGRISGPRTGGRPPIEVVPVPGADHSMRVLASSPLPADDVATLVTDAVAAFLVRHVTT